MAATPTILVTGCSSGFGDLIARTLAQNGHHLYATMRDIATRNARAAERLQAWAATDQLPLEVRACARAPGTFITTARRNALDSEA